MRPVGGGSGEIYCIIEQGRKGKKAFINVSLLFCMKCILGPYTCRRGKTRKRYNLACTEATRRKSSDYSVLVMLLQMQLWNDRAFSSARLVDVLCSALARNAVQWLRLVP